MSRYTKNNLKVDLAELNEKLEKAGSTCSFKYEGRNNYHAVDLYKGDRCMRCVDCAEPPIMLFYKAQQEFNYIMSCKEDE